MRFPLSPPTPSFHFNSTSSSSSNTLTKSQKRPTHTSFLPFEIPTRVAEAFDFPYDYSPRANSGMKPNSRSSSARYVETIETVMSYDKEESFSPFGERTGKGMSLGFGLGFRTKSKSKKEKRGTLTLPVQHPPPSALIQSGSYSRTVTPARSIDSLASALSAGPSIAPKLLPRVRPPRVVEEDHLPSASPPTISLHPVHLPAISPRRPPPPRPKQHSPTGDDRAIAELERFSHHLLAENKIPGYQHRSNVAYDPSRAAPRTRNDPIIAAVVPDRMADGFIMVKHPSGARGPPSAGQGYIKTSDRRLVEAEAEELARKEKQQSSSVRGWRKLRPTSSGGKTKDRPVSEGSRASRAVGSGDMPPLPSTTVAGVGAQPGPDVLSGSRLGRGITRMRSISSTRLADPQPYAHAALRPPATSKTTSDNTSVSSSYSSTHAAPAIPPRAPSRPAPMSRHSGSADTSDGTVTAGYSYVPLMLSPSREEVGEVRATMPRAAIRDSLNSRTGTDVTLMSPRTTPIQLTPLPPAIALPLPPFPTVSQHSTLSHPHLTPSLLTSSTRKPSVSTSTSRFSKLRIKRSPPESLSIISSLSSTSRSRASTGAAPTHVLGHALTGRARASTQSTGTGMGDGDSIAEEGLRVLDEIRRVERIQLVPREERRPPGSIKSRGSGEKERVREVENIEFATGGEGTRRQKAKRSALGGMTALSFLAMDFELGEGKDTFTEGLGVTDTTHHDSARPRISSSDENHTTAGGHTYLARVQPQPYLPPALHPAYYRQTSLESHRIQPVDNIMAITHIIPPEERSRIGTSISGVKLVSSPRSGSRRRYSQARGSISSFDDEAGHGSQSSPRSQGQGQAKTNRRRSQLIEFHNLHVLKRGSPTASSTSYIRSPKPHSPYSPHDWSFGSDRPTAPTALSPPPRSRRMTGRAGSAPGANGPNFVPSQEPNVVTGRGAGLSPGLGQAQGGYRSLSMGALGAGGVAARSEAWPATAGTVHRKDATSPVDIQGRSDTISPYPQPTRSATGVQTLSEEEDDDKDGVEPLFISSSLRYHRRSRRVSRLCSGDTSGSIEEVSDRSLELILHGEFGGTLST